MNFSAIFINAGRARVVDEMQLIAVRKGEIHAAGLMPQQEPLSVDLLLFPQWQMSSQYRALTYNATRYGMAARAVDTLSCKRQGSYKELCIRTVKNCLHQE